MNATEKAKLGQLARLLGGFSHDHAGEFACYFPNLGTARAFYHTVRSIISIQNVVSHCGTTVSVSDDVLTH